MVDAPTTHYAICILNEDGNSGVKGITKFTQVEGQPIQMNAEMTGLTAGLHGFHVHVFGKSQTHRFNRREALSLG